MFAKERAALVYQSGLRGLLEVFCAVQHDLQNSQVRRGPRPSCSVCQEAQPLNLDMEAF